MTRTGSAVPGAFGPLDAHDHHAAAGALICVFAKPPLPGTVKTRLARAIGEARAADVARAFLQDTWSLVTRFAGAKAILASTSTEPSAHGLLDLASPPTIWLQGEGDLGARIERIVHRGLSEAESVICIGADSPGLPERLLADAARLLAESDAVLGPSDDGGFYLLGLRRCPVGLFSDLPWSAANTFAATRSRIEERQMSLAVLDRWFDVDTAADLERLTTMLSRGELRAERTARALARGSERPPA